MRPTRRHLTLFALAVLFVIPAPGRASDSAPAMLAAHAPTTAHDRTAAPPLLAGLVDGLRARLTRPAATSPSVRITRAAANELLDYCTKCYADLGIKKEDLEALAPFKCKDSNAKALVATVNGVDRDGDATQPTECDYPAWLGSGTAGHQCYGHTYIQKFEITNNKSERVVGALICRHKTRWNDDPKDFDDVAMILHNKVSGVTCWFQTRDGDTTHINGTALPAPHTDAVAAAKDRYWLDPSNASYIGCVSCHDNGPWMNSRWLDNSDIKLKDGRGPYTNAGAGFDNWPKPLFVTVADGGLVNADPVAVPPRVSADARFRCTACHKIHAAGQFKLPGNPDPYTFATHQSWLNYTTGQAFAPQTNATGKGFAIAYWMPTNADEVNAADWKKRFKKHVDLVRTCMAKKGVPDPADKADPCQIFDPTRATPMPAPNGATAARRVTSAGIQLTATVSGALPGSYSVQAPPDSDGSIYPLAPGSLVHLDWATDGLHPTAYVEATFPAGVEINGVHTSTYWGQQEIAPTIGPFVVPGLYRFDFTADDDAYDHINASLTFQVAGTPPTVLAVEAIVDSTGTGRAFTYPLPARRHVETTTDGSVPVHVGWSSDNVVPGSCVLRETFSPGAYSTNLFPDESGYMEVQVHPNTDNTYCLICQRNDGTGALDSVTTVVHVGGATPTLVSDFEATSGIGGVTLHYVLREDGSVVGVNIYRSAGDDSEEQRINLSPLPTNGQGVYDYTDESVRPNTAYTYRLGLVDRTGHETHAGFTRAETQGGWLAMAKPQPNPTSVGFSLRLAVPQDTQASVRIFDVGGRRVASLYDGPMKAGERTLVWDGRRDDGSRPRDGVYFVELQTLGRKLTERVVIRR